MAVFIQGVEQLWSAPVLAAVAVAGAASSMHG